MYVKGIDVSSYQSDSYGTGGLDFAFIKATEGISYVNPRMEKQASTARKAGLVVGFYHFLHPGALDGQAQHFVSRCASLPGDILAVDWESTSAGSATCKEKDSFIAKIKALRPRHRVILYCNRDFWIHRDTTSFTGDGLWIADYVAEGNPRIKAHWLFHQYSDKPVDRNVSSFASRESLRVWSRGLLNPLHAESNDERCSDRRGK
ncbi:glycoside hydrolase family 25 protein [Streptomyces syringium]|uniref:glycoside hydrolase family 25 protein n=1 Tax=Streptomyces syringium TaxID=76729 RepID=UPI003452A7F8